MNKLRIATILLLVITTSKCAHLNSPANNSQQALNSGQASCNIPNDRKIKFTVLHTNDHHGRFWKSKTGEHGMAARMTLVNRIREQASKDGRMVLLLSGGDINTGIPASDILKAKPDFLGMKKLQYDAMAVGNHEFDNPLTQILEQRAWAGFPFLAANILYKNRQQGQPFPAYIQKKYQGLTIAIVGFTTHDTPHITDAENTKTVDFIPPVEVAKDLIPQLQKTNDIIIAITHMGHYNDGKHGTNAYGDVTLARSVPGIDLIVGGHTQEMLAQPDRQNGTLIVQAHQWGRYVGKVDLAYTCQRGLQLENYRLIPINLKETVVENNQQVTKYIDPEIPENPDMIALLSPFNDQAKGKLDVQIGIADGFFNGARVAVRKQETNLGNFITWAIKKFSQTDMAIFNSGSIRDSIEAGPISYGDILRVHPWSTTIATVKLTGNELRAYIQGIMDIATPGSGGFPHFSGLSMKIMAGKITKIALNGKELKDTSVYKVGVPSFVATGGDKYPPMNLHPTYVDTGKTVDQILKDAIVKLGTIKAAQFKVTSYLVRVKPPN